MKTKLTGAQHEMFEHLTSRTFYVVDTEYTSGPDKDGNHLISIAVVPVVAGRRNTKDDFYKEMNPGVPIDPRATAKNRFTDTFVKGKKSFGFYAKPIIDALTDPDAVFVAHTNCDILVLRAELTRLDQARTREDVKSWPALAGLPELPIIDTSTLPRLVALEGLGHRGSISLERLCELTSARNRKPHHALSDARATADALLELLAHVAKKASFYDLSELLRAHDRGTTASPRGPAHIRSRREYDPALPPSHVARHVNPLDHTGTREELLAWTDLAAECVELRCQWLRDEVRAAATDNGPSLLDPLVKLLPNASQPGQVGTLLGAVYQLIAPQDPGVEPAFAATRPPLVGHRSSTSGGQPAVRRQQRRSVPLMPGRAALPARRHVPGHRRNGRARHGQRPDPQTHHRLPARQEPVPQNQPLAKEASRGRRVDALACGRIRAGPGPC